MINELYHLTVAMDRAGIIPESIHDQYMPLPNVTSKKPCIRITIADGKVLEISSIKPGLGAVLRKYGSNQGSYPCMNLTPLYRLSEKEMKQEISTLKPEDLTDDKLLRLKELCIETNWDEKFQKKYKISFVKVPGELNKMLPDYQPLNILIRQSDYFKDPEKLHSELKRAAFQMLREKENIALAISILFCSKKDSEEEDGKKSSEGKDNLSVALETPMLMEIGIPATSERFVKDFNRALLGAENGEKPGEDVDAFMHPFAPIDTPMPKVKLAGGITISLRTMFDGQPCQTRYGKIGGGSYPLSADMRKRLKSALEWVGSPERKHKTWINTDKGEILFAYPSRLPEADYSCVDLFGGDEDNELSFLDLAERLILQLQKYSKNREDPDPEIMQVFIVRKIDNGRSKVVYTRQTTAEDLGKCGRLWDAGCKNIPDFPFGKPQSLFPLKVSTVLNRFWKSNGAIATEKCRPVPKYHGMELLFDPNASVSMDLYTLTQKTYKIAPFLGNQLLQGDRNLPILEDAMNTASLMGCFLYREGIRKDDYMKKFPFAYGQLLKTSDELHMLYCKVVRKNSYPAQFVGSAVYQAALDAPTQTLNLLGQRMRPYISWAEGYTQGKTSSQTDEGKAVKRILSTYARLGNVLAAEFPEKVRFDDEDKAQFFLGYLASFPNENSILK